MALVPGPPRKHLDSESPRLSLPKKADNKDIEKGPEPHHDQTASTHPPQTQSEAHEISTTTNSKITHKEHKENKENKEKGGEDELEYDPEDDVWALDEGKPSIGRKYARSVIEAFHPFLYLSVSLGLFPLVPRRNKDGTYTVKFEWCSYACLSFLFVGTIVTSSTLWMLCSFIAISTNYPKHPSVFGKTRKIFRSEEVFVYKRNAVTLVGMIASFVHLMICMVAVFFRRDYIAKQLVYWTEVVELLQLDIGRHVAKRLWKQLAVILTVGVLLVVIYVRDISPGLSGSGSTFYIVMTRIVDPLALWHEELRFRQLGCKIFMLYCVFAGYLYILWFFYNCRILTNILRIWNNRFQYCLHKHVLEFTNVRESRDVSFKTSHRTSRASLFKDHLVIFNLLEGVNTQFQIIMESFYLSTMIMIVFEAYGFVHACFYDEYVHCNRQWDMIPLFLILALQIFLYLTVTLEAAGVADEARHVLDIVRRKGMMTSRMDVELWFMLSMRLSFGGHEDVGIIGAGFIYVTKSFLLGALSAIASHFIIFYQFEVPYAQTAEADANFELLDVKKIIQQTEGLNSTSIC